MSFCTGQLTRRTRGTGSFAGREGRQGGESELRSRGIVHTGLMNHSDELGFYLRARGV